jgi:cell pole-organizing protein PopZ
MPAEGRTLEDVVRELLRPLLKAWLDEHLPGIVQAAVAEEVERVSRRRV